MSLNPYIETYIKNKDIKSAIPIMLSVGQNKVKVDLIAIQAIFVTDTNGLINCQADFLLNPRENSFNNTQYICLDLKKKWFDKVRYNVNSGETYTNNLETLSTTGRIKRYRGEIVHWVMPETWMSNPSSSPYSLEGYRKQALADDLMVIMTNLDDLKIPNNLKLKCFDISDVTYSDFSHITGKT